MSPEVMFVLRASPSGARASPHRETRPPQGGNGPWVHTARQKLSSVTAFPIRRGTSQGTLRKGKTASCPWWFRQRQ